MEDQVPFKVYTFWRENEKPEVRRFGVERSLVTSFLYLNAKIQEIYPGLKDKTYSMAWKDEEGDDVTVSSDDEVLMALGSMRDDLVKLYIYCKEGDDSKEDDCDIVITAVSGGGKNAIHYGVVCDSCDSSVVGFRYKCTTCDDYDLCTKCEAAGSHPQHCMVRIPMPTMPRTVIKAAIKRSRHFLKTVAGSVGEECPYKRHRRDKSGDRKHHGEHHGEHHRGDRHHRRPRSGWFDTFATYMNEFANLAGDAGMDMGNKTDDKEQQKTNADNTQSPNSTTAGENAEAPKQPEPCTSSGEPRCPFMPEQMNVQKLLQMYLDGRLNLNSFMPQPQPTPSPASSNDASVNTNGVPTNNAFVGTSDVEMGQGDRLSEADKVSIKSEVSSVSSKRDESPDKADDWTVINKEKDLMDAYVMKPTVSNPEPTAPIGFNLPEEFQERVRISEGQNLYPPLNTATAVLNPKDPERSYAAAAATAWGTSPQQPPAAQPDMVPQPNAASPKPPAAQPQPTAAYPHPAAAQPNPAAAYPHPAAVQPHPAAAYPHPAAAQPKPAAAQPQPAVTQPRPAPYPQPTPTPAQPVQQQRQRHPKKERKEFIERM